jgi:hypothetical protein
VVLWQVTKESHVVSQDEKSLELFYSIVFIVAYIGTAVIKKTCAKLNNVCLGNCIPISTGTSAVYHQPYLKYAST